MLKENGSFEKEKKWKAKSRISAILLNVTRANGTKLCVMAFLILIVVIFTLAVGVLGHSAGIATRGNLTKLDKVTPNGQFVYPPKQNLMYPTCNLMNTGNETDLIDYTFLSAIMYQHGDTHQKMLDNWFGSGVAELDSNTTRAFREGKGKGIKNLAVSYNIVSFEGNKSVVTVRGSQTAWVSPMNAKLH